MKVLIVEDDAALQLFLRKGLELEGHTVAMARDGDEAVAAVAQHLPDLIVLDLNLPRRDGMDVLRELHGQLEATSILVLTGRGSVEDRVTCLDLGADDYLLKPFSFHELLARCRAIGRRRVGSASSVVRHGNLCVDRVSRVVSRGDVPIDLTSKEFALLDYLLQHRGRAVGRPELLANVWKMSPDAGTNVVDVYVNYLRRKLQTDAAEADLVETVRGAGYTIRPQATAPASAVQPLARRPVQSAGLADAARVPVLMAGAA